MTCSSPCSTSGRELGFGAAGLLSASGRTGYRPCTALHPDRFRHSPLLAQSGAAWMRVWSEVQAAHMATVGQVRRDQVVEDGHVRPSYS